MEKRSSRRLCVLLAAVCIKIHLAHHTERTARQISKFICAVKIFSHLLIIAQTCERKPDGPLARGEIIVRVTDRASIIAPSA